MLLNVTCNFIIFFETPNSIVFFFSSSSLFPSLTMDYELLPSGSYTTEELARLAELQKRHSELRDASKEEFILDDEEDDDFSVHARDTQKKGPTIPDMRFEQQVDKSIHVLKEAGASNTQIFFSVVIKDQILIPFASGFVWSLCSNAWIWYRTKGIVNKDPKKLGLFAGIGAGLTGWTR